LVIEELSGEACAIFEVERTLALKSSDQARRILAQFGQKPTLARIDAALAELG